MPKKKILAVDDEYEAKDLLDEIKSIIGKQ